MRSLTPGSAVVWLVCGVTAAGACSDDAATSTAGAGGSGASTSTSIAASGTTTTTSSASSGSAQSTTATSGSSSSAGGGGAAEGGGGNAGCGPLPLIDEPPDTLSETGLFDDITTDTIAAWAQPFQPLYPLWSDGATKRRWFYLPQCEQIDTTDMDTWQVPVGTRLWKEFTRDGIRVETRFIMRTGPGITDFEFATYEWGNGEAYRVENGVLDSHGTGHDIPDQSLCSSCHEKDWRVLGLSAIQLTHGLPGATMASLSADGLLTTPLPGGVVIPGNDVERAALGYLHANCGNCHFDAGVPSVDILFKVRQANTTVMDTDTYTTAVNQLTEMYSCGGCDRIEPGNPGASAVIMRMAESSMPPVASEVVDDDGITTVSAWINQLPP
jgi:hypothetical protein